MPPVKFDEQDDMRPNFAEQKSHGAITELIMKLGLAKEPGQANIVMLVIALIAIALAVYFTFFY